VTKVPVNPEVLKWARNERGLTPSEAATRLGITIGEIEALESGAEVPTVTTLRDIAAKYEIGFSSLLMPQPLAATTRLRVQDFRTNQSAREKWHPDLLTAMDEVNVVLDAFADLKPVADDLLKSDLPGLGALSNANRVADTERRRIGLSAPVQFGWRTPADGFRRLRSMIEAQGVFVHVVTASTIKDWRGLAILDERNIPLIIINGAETDPSARSFSLLHEYAHILRRQNAISDHNRTNLVEAFCNKFAAHFLMPDEIFSAEVRVLGGGYRETWTDLQLKKIGARFKTSMSAVAIHLENLGFAPDGFYNGKLAEWRLRTATPREPGPVGYYKKMANRLGNRHISVVFDAMDRGYINQLDAYEMLDVNPANFAKLRSEVKERQDAYGWRG
jgi:Zn-dependent peptidase ImmA (M78 family)/transcriptional regulator with XRE-family HTH domain